MRPGPKQMKLNYKKNLWKKKTGRQKRKEKQTSLEGTVIGRASQEKSALNKNCYGSRNQRIMAEKEKKGCSDGGTHPVFAGKKRDELPPRGETSRSIQTGRGVPR